MTYANYQPLRFIQSGTPFLPLQAVDAVPERYDVTRFGERFPGSSPLVRKLDGRIHGSVCYRAHRIVVTVLPNPAFAASRGFSATTDRAQLVFLSYTTGLGTQHFELRCTATHTRLPEVLSLSDDALHAVLFGMIHSMMEAARYGYQLAAREYRAAFADGRLKKSRARGQVRVWIDDETNHTFERAPAVVAGVPAEAVGHHTV